MTESSDAGASRANKIGTLRPASDFGMNDVIDFDGKPCRVISASTKMGLRQFHTMNILTGYSVHRLVRMSREFAVPDVRHDFYKLIGISKDDSLTLLHYTGAYTREDIFLPDKENLRTMMVDAFNDDKIVLVGVVTSLGQSAVYVAEVYGSELSEDELMQRATTVGFNE